MLTKIIFWAFWFDSEFPELGIVIRHRTEFIHLLKNCSERSKVVPKETRECRCCAVKVKFRTNPTNQKHQLKNPSKSGSDMVPVTTTNFPWCCSKWNDTSFDFKWNTVPPSQMKTGQFNEEPLYLPLWVKSGLQTILE